MVVGKGGWGWVGQKTAKGVGGYGELFFSKRDAHPPNPSLHPLGRVGRLGVRGEGFHDRPHPSLLMPGPSEPSLMHMGACTDECRSSPALCTPP